jgi:hypothetical protein
MSIVPFDVEHPDQKAGGDDTALQTSAGAQSIMDLHLEPFKSAEPSPDLNAFVHRWLGAFSCSLSYASDEELDDARYGFLCPEGAMESSRWCERERATTGTILREHVHPEGMQGSRGV